MRTEVNIFSSLVSQFRVTLQTFTCSKSTTETLEQGEVTNMFKVNNRHQNYCRVTVILKPAIQRCS